jgi:hypothetical protein
MGFINRVSYLTGLFRMLPFGLIALFFGIRGLVKYQTVEKYQKIEGEIIYSGIKKIRFKDTYMDAFVLELADENSDTIQCYSYYKGYHSIAKELRTKIGDDLTVWVNEDLKNEIIQIEYQQELLIEYNGATGLYLFFLFIGVVYSVVTLWYLVTHPEHLFKKNDS